MEWFVCLRSPCIYSLCSLLGVACVCVTAHVVKEGSPPPLSAVSPRLQSPRMLISRSTSSPAGARRGRRSSSPPPAAAARRQPQSQRELSQPPPHGPDPSVHDPLQGSNASPEGVMVHLSFDDTKSARTQPAPSLAAQQPITVEDDPFRVTPMTTDPWASQQSRLMLGPDELLSPASSQLHASSPTASPPPASSQPHHRGRKGRRRHRKEHTPALSALLVKSATGRSKTPTSAVSGHRSKQKSPHPPPPEPLPHSKSDERWRNRLRSPSPPQEPGPTIWYTDHSGTSLRMSLRTPPPTVPTRRRRKGGRGDTNNVTTPKHVKRRGDAGDDAGMLACKQKLDELEASLTHACGTRALVHEMTQLAERLRKLSLAAAAKTPTRHKAAR